MEDDKLVGTETDKANAGTEKVEQEAKASKPVARKDNSKGSDKSSNSLGSKFGNVVSEFKKIVWPSRKDLMKQTVTVIITSLLVGVIILGLDSVLSVLLSFYTKMLG